MSVGLSLVPQGDNTPDSRKSIVPDKPWEAGKWFHDNYAPYLKVHVDMLVRFGVNIEKGQGISFSSLENDVFHARYGKYSLYFPQEEEFKKMSPSEWIASYRIEIDGEEVLVDTGIQSIEKITQLQSENILSEKKVGFVDTLLPSRAMNQNRIPTIRTTKNTPLKRSIRIIKR